MSSDTNQVIVALNDPAETVSEIVASWNDSQERLLKGIAERSNCMRWLHTESSLYFQNVNFYLTIPNIIISTLNGSFTMSLTSLKSQQMMEAHRSASLAYSKLSRSVTNQLSLRRDQRTDGLHFLNSVRTEMDRLESISPNIRPYIIARFKIQFNENHLEKPEITGDLDEVSINQEVIDTIDSKKKTSTP